MSEKAFPAPYWNDDRMMYLNQGMTLRDYFAAKAMHALYLSNCEWEATGGPRDMESVALIEELSIDAYQLADAMLKARGQ